VIAPVLATSLDSGAREATRATTAEVLEASVSFRTKVALATDLRDLVANAPRGEVPDPRVPFDEHGAAKNPKLAAARDGVVAAIRDTLTRAFRPAFLIAAGFGAAAGLVALVLALRLIAGERAVRTGRDTDAVVVAGAIAALVVLLVVAELRAGAVDFGTRRYVDPCEGVADPFPQGEGLDGTLQRISLSAIDGAACKLGTSREELLLSLEQRSGFGDEVRWDKKTLNEAVRAGLVRAIDDADHRNSLPGLVAGALRIAAQHAPVDWILGRVDIPFLEE
jgi:hypothetical protein